MTEFYSNVEDDEEEIDSDGSSKSSSHALEIDLYVKQTFIKSSESDSEREEGEYNPLSFWRKMHSSYPILSKVTARILAVPASSAAVERQFSLTGNIITQKRARLCPDMFNDMVFQHSFKIYQGKLDNHDAWLNWPEITFYLFYICMNVCCSNEIDFLVMNAKRILSR